MSGDGRDPPACTVLVCRACCCGSAAKHPLTDHDRQLADLERAVAAAPGSRLRVVDCLDVCSRSNVVVLRPRQGRAVWLGDVLEADVTAALAGWVAGGGPDAQPVPDVLAGRVFEPSAVAVRLSRRERRPTAG
jgi:hypothetical protein